MNVLHNSPSIAAFSLARLQARLIRFTFRSQNFLPLCPAENSRSSSQIITGATIISELSFGIEDPSLVEGGHLFLLLSSGLLKSDEVLNPICSGYSQWR